MTFEKVETHIDFPAQERAILAYWERIGAFEQLRAKNRGKPKWSFLDGPITANNPMGVHHAWGRTYKDAYQRYFAMTGHEERYQNGFDCQGLWVEVEVEKELNLKTKRDIENLVPGDRFASIDKFVQLCKQRVDTFAKRQTEQSIRLGYWMDWDREEDWQKPADERRSYYTMSAENNYTIWSFLKKCHERSLVFSDYDAMPWCPRCGVGISQMEMHEGYKLVAHRAPFVVFPLRHQGADAPRSPGTLKENLLVWTTTPWTLTSNVAAAVNPQLTYLKVRLRDQIYYLAKGAFTAHRKEEEFKRKEWLEGVPKLKSLEQIFKEKAGKGGYEVLGELPGLAMIGWEYDGPFDELPAQNHPGGYPIEIADVAQKQKWASPKSSKALHRVIAWDAVGEVEGTGIVHIAPGCGKEDFGLGKVDHLVAIAPLDDAGIFLPGFGELTGRSAVDPATADWILTNLQEKGVLFNVEKYPHSYPHCWRCKTELLFRLIDEWFINMSWRDEIKEVVKQATWLPESINGQARELDWLTNMGDWMISKKRFWGLALPIWVCDKCGHFDVIGSREELKKRAISGWEQFEGHTPHRPWIDQVRLQCGKCKSEMSRIPDVGNPWLDAGIVPYSTMKYNTDRAYWEKWFPADFITEAFPGQFRNWFYAILALSTMMENKTPFRKLLGHGQVRDQWGEEMHKSKGNSIPFDGAADGEEMPGSAERVYQIRHELKPGEQAKVPGALSVEVVEKVLNGTKVREVVATCPPMSADLIRWLYCRHNPAQNINFGPGPAEELRSKFTLKLWNCYSFFVNYAILDGFDPKAPQVPVKKRPDIDQWILSDLQLLIRNAKESFESFNVMTFCLEAEKFVDDKLSNWYIRRNRRRFWKSESGSDKDAAYQTLYTVLTTLAKLFAPIMPFLTEEMHKNLVSKDSSVHLCDFPKADEGLIDEDLSAKMEAVFRLVSLGFAARNHAKIKVKQVLSEMKVDSDDPDIQEAIKTFRDQISEELNIKHVPAVDKTAPLFYIRRAYLADEKIKAKCGSKFRQVSLKFNELDEDKRLEIANKNEPQIFPLDSGDFVTLDKECFKIAFEGNKGWEVVEQFDTVVGVYTEVSEDLLNEGLARGVIRQIQMVRKNTGLNMEDRIELMLIAESEVIQKAIEAHKDYIANETLTNFWPTRMEGEFAEAKVKIEGHELTIRLRKMGEQIA